MRKYFEDLSFTEGVLLISVFVFAIFLRFFDLDVQSSWTDELASWFFLRNLDQVFYYESHSPFYYLLLRIFLGEEASLYSIRAFSAFLSLLNLIAIYFLGQRFMERPKVIALVIMLALNPTDIVYARMARHYSLLLEGSLLFYFLIRGHVRTWICSVFAFVLGFIHIFALIPMTIILLFQWFKEKKLRKVGIIFLSSTGIIFYYVIRLLSFGSKRVGENVSWNSSDFKYFLESTVAQFLGEAYPRLQTFPVNMTLAYVVTALLFFYALFRRKETLFLFITIFAGSVLFIEILNTSWINLRINRYVIYLSAFLILAFVDALPSIGKKSLVAVFLGSVGLIVPLNLTTVYPWDDEVVQEWKAYSSQFKDVKQFVCSNKYQSAYYDLKAPKLCRDAIAQINFKEPLLFFDLNNNDGLVALYITEKMRAVYFKDLVHSRIIHFEPR